MRDTEFVPGPGMQLSSPIAASLSNPAALAEELERSRVLSRERIEKVLTDFSGGSVLRLAELLVASGELTSFQAERTLAGQARSLIVGPYRLQEPHQIGTFGPIFRATRGADEYAVRVLPLRSLWQARQARQLVRSFSALASVPSIVPLADADSANGYHFLAWPLVNGELLADRIATRGPQDAKSTLTLLIRLASALAACHNAQIFHGLLTPQSVCVEANGTPRLLELGAGMLLARNLASDDSLFDTMSAATAVAGAFDFAAPEWVADPSRLTPAADQYSLGAIGCFALTGSVPSTGAKPRWTPAVPYELATILNRMLQAVPGDRYSGLSEVWAALMEVAGLQGGAPLDPDPSDCKSRRSSGREADWPAADSRPKPFERDTSAASVHFDLPDSPPEPAVAETAGTLRAQSERETPTAPVLSAAQMLRTIPEPRLQIVDSELLDEEEETTPPALPAAPLLPLSSDCPSSGSWAVASAKPASFHDAEPPPAGSVLWKTMKRKVLFWQTTGDTVQVSVYGPLEAAHSESPHLTVFLHTLSAAASVSTLARAFHHDAVLLGTSALSQTVARGSRVDVHLSVAHAPVSNPLGSFTWKGQPYRLTFDLVVPWEAPVGLARGILSIGRDEVRVGKVEFGITIHDGNG